MDVVFLCGPTLDGFQRGVLDTFLRAGRAQGIVGCVIDSRPVPSLWRRTRKHLVQGRGGYVLIMALNRLSRSRAPSTDTDTGAFFQELGVPIITTDDPYREETLQRICALRPGVLVRLGGFGIVKPPLLRLIPLGVLSYHHGDMRKYRGQRLLGARRASRGSE